MHRIRLHAGGRRLNPPPSGSLKARVLSDARDALAGNGYVKLLRHRWGRVLAAALAVAAAATGLAGGFDRVEKPTGIAALEPQPAGAAVDAGLYDVTVHSAWRSHRPSQKLDYVDPDSDMLYVAATVTWLDRRSMPPAGKLGQDLVWLAGEAGAPGDPRMATSVERVGGAQLTLQPGMPTQAVLSWRLSPRDPPVPALLRVAVMGYTFSPSTWLTQKEGWVRAAPAGLWEIAVEDRRPGELTAVEAGR